MEFMITIVSLLVGHQKGNVKGLAVKQECLEVSVLEYSRSVCFAEAVENLSSQIHHKVWAKMNIMRTFI